MFERRGRRAKGEKAMAACEEVVALEQTEHEIDYGTAEIIFAGTVVFITIFPMLFMRVLLQVLNAM